MKLPKINQLPINILCVSVGLLSNFLVNANGNDFYRPATEFSTIEYFNAGHKSKDIFSYDDSHLLQQAIDRVSTNGGGKLIIAAGHYAINEIWLKSNVHLEIDSKAVFRPFLSKKTAKHGDRKKSKKSYVLFNLSSLTTKALQNVSIKGINGNFTVDISQVPEQFNRVFMLKNVENFLIENVDIKDQHSKFSAFVLNGETIKGYVYSPRFGVIRNANLYQADYGYGLVQMQLGDKILFDNLYSKGGTTLRLETHTKNLYDPTRFSPVNNVIARNIRCENGNSAFMASPHYVKNGKFEADSIQAHNCGWAARISSGFVNENEKKIGLTPGEFSKSSTLSNVSATYNSNSAQLKPKHYRYMPCELRSLISKQPISAFPHGDSFSGPAIGVLLNTADYAKLISAKSVSGTSGFIKKQQYIEKKDQLKKCAS